MLQSKHHLCRFAIRINGRKERLRYAFFKDKPGKDTRAGWPLLKKYRFRIELFHFCQSLLKSSNFSLVKHQTLVSLRREDDRVQMISPGPVRVMIAKKQWFIFTTTGRCCWCWPF